MSIFMVQCTAKSKRTHERCKAQAVTGSSKCYHHGGASKRGAELPQFKTGARSNYMPAKLAKLYGEIEDDHEANVLKRNLKLREALLRQDLEHLEDAPDAPLLWADMRKILDKLNSAFKMGDDPTVTTQLELLGRLTDERLRYYEARHALNEQLNEQRRDKQALVAIEMRGEQAISVVELMTFVSAILNLIAQSVSNLDERSKIANGIDRLFHLEAGVVKESASVEGE